MRSGFTDEVTVLDSELTAADTAGELLFEILKDDSPLEIRMGTGYCSCSCDDDFTP
jgi:hypothetical protein